MVFIGCFISNGSLKKNIQTEQLDIYSGRQNALIKELKALKESNISDRNKELASRFQIISFQQAQAI